MTYTDIDKKFDKEFMVYKSKVDAIELAMDGLDVSEVKSFIHQIYSQAKAEQRGEWIKKIDKMWMNPPWSAEWDAECYKIDGYRRAIKDVIQSLNEETK